MIKLSLFAGLTLFIFMAAAWPKDAAYPSVRELEKALFLRPGESLPKQVLTNVGLFQPRYIKAVNRGNGEYIVTIKLDREK